MTIGMRFVTTSPSTRSIPAVSSYVTQSRFGFEPDGSVRSRVYGGSALGLVLLSSALFMRKHAFLAFLFFLFALIRALFIFRVHTKNILRHFSVLRFPTVEMLRSQLKRKRADVAAGRTVAIYKAPRRVYKKRRFTPGVDRTGGFYGRFSGRGGELKFHDVDLDDAVVANTGVVTDSICLIAQGVTESTRVGRRCTIRSIYWKYRVDLPEVNNVTTPNTIDQVRVILFVDKQCNGATAATLDILETANVHSFRNLANQSRFTILLDKLVNLRWATLAADAANTFDMAEVVTEHSFYKKCNIPLEFSDVTGAITEIRSNNIGVLLQGLNGTAGFISKFRLRFSDQS